MVAIASLAGNVEKKIKLGGREQGEGVAHEVKKSRHSRSNILALVVPRVACSLVGN